MLLRRGPQVALKAGSLQKRAGATSLPHVASLRSSTRLPLLGRVRRVAPLVLGALSAARSPSVGVGSLLELVDVDLKDEREISVRDTKVRPPFSVFVRPGGLTKG